MVRQYFLSSALMSGPLLLLLFKVCVCDAYFDWGHMTVAAVANRTLYNKGRSDVVEKIETMLSYNSYEFPEFSSFITAAAWADHVKCINATDSNNRQGPTCNNKGQQPRFDDWTILNDLHYNDIPLYFGSCTGDNVTNENVPYFILNEQVGVGKAINYMLQSTSVGYKTPVATEAPTTTTSPSAERRLAEGSFPSNHGTAWGYSIILRFLIHTYGDMHLPLHASAAYSRITDCLSDLGGSIMPIKSSICPFFDDLHHIWDSGCCMASNSSYPDFDQDDANTMADTLMGKYPEADFASGKLLWPLDGDFATAMTESFVAAKEYAYACFDWENIDPNYKLDLDQCNTFGNGTASPTSYLDNCQLVAGQRAALAGYRLANILLDVASNIPIDVLTFVSAHESPDSATGCLALGVTSYIFLAFYWFA